MDTHEKIIADTVLEMTDLKIKELKSVAPYEYWHVVIPLLEELAKQRINHLRNHKPDKYNELIEEFNTNYR